jgi:hypothetical protein
LAGCVRLLHERTILVLIILFCIGIGCTLWYVSRLQSNLIASIALQDASLYSQALAEFRTLYTSEVVETVRQRGIKVTHDYIDHAGAIPLPVTLTMLLGKRISGHEAGAQLRLYSPYPFPWRQQEGGLHDAFGQQAWDALQHNPTTPFYRFETFQGHPSLRYATADLMRPGGMSAGFWRSFSPSIPPLYRPIWACGAYLLSWQSCPGWGYQAWPWSLEGYGAARRIWRSVPVAWKAKSPSASG